MTTIAIRRRTAQPAAHPVRRATRVRAVLLACGLPSSLLYVAMLVFVATRREEYSSASRTVTSSPRSALRRGRRGSRWPPSTPCS